MQQSTTESAKIVQNQIEKSWREKIVGKHMQIPRRHAENFSAISNGNLSPRMRVQLVGETLKVKIWTLMSPRIVEQMRREQNNWLGLQSLFWKFAGLGSEIGRRAAFSSYPGLRWHRMTTNQVFIISKVCEDIINEWEKETFWRTGMIPANICITSSNRAVENHTFFLRNTLANK